MKKIIEVNMDDTAKGNLIVYYSENRWLYQFDKGSCILDKVDLLTVNSYLHILSVPWNQNRDDKGRKFHYMINGIILKDFWLTTLTHFIFFPVALLIIW